LVSFCSYLGSEGIIPARDICDDSEITNFYGERIKNEEISGFEVPMDYRKRMKIVHPHTDVEDDGKEGASGEWLALVREAVEKHVKGFE
jgi:hypothetical protein